MSEGRHNNDSNERVHMQSQKKNKEKIKKTLK